MSDRLPARRSAHTLVFALAIPPEQVVPSLLARDRVRERDEGAPLPADITYDLERTADGFTLTSDPGSWRPGTRAICEGRLVARPGGAELVVQFRLHPLTRGAFALLTLLGLAMVGFQLSVAGPTTAAVLLLPILVLMAILAADRSGLRRQQEALRSLIESTFTPLAQPRESAPDDPFRLPAPARPPR